LAQAGWLKPFLLQGAMAHFCVMAVTLLSFVAMLCIVNPLSSWQTRSMSVVALAIFQAIFVAFRYRRWRRDFSWRSGRRQPTCPSHGSLPSLLTRLHAGVVDKRVRPVQENLRQRSRPQTNVCNAEGLPVGEYLSNEPNTLDMDHVYMNFLNYMWCSYFVFLNASVLVFAGTVTLFTRRAMVKWGWLTHPVMRPTYDARSMLGRILLNSSHVLHYLNKRQDKDGTWIATVGYKHVLIPDEDNNINTIETFLIEVDLPSQRMIKAVVDDEEISPGDALLLAIWIAQVIDHPKLHAFANWGLNVDHPDPFIRRNSVVSVMYNNFGAKSLGEVVEGLYELGMLSRDFSPSVQAAIRHGIKQGVGYHGHLTELKDHVEYVKFMLAVRNKFMNSFSKWKNHFWGMDGEAFFLSTVVHAIDHFNPVEIIPDALLLENASKFHHLVECVTVVRSRSRN
jgi:hypothetical protein